MAATSISFAGNVSGPAAARKGHRALFKRLPQLFQNTARKLRAAHRETKLPDAPGSPHPAGHAAAAADQSRVGNRMMRGSERPLP